MHQFLHAATLLHFAYLLITNFGVWHGTDNSIIETAVDECLGHL